MLQSQLQSIVEKFAVSATVSTIRPLGSGLINDTYLVVTEEKDQPDYVLQRINHEVFPDVDMVMRNIAIVTRHIREATDCAGRDRFAPPCPGVFCPLSRMPIGCMRRSMAIIGV